MLYVWIFKLVCDIYVIELEFNCMVYWCFFYVWVLREGIEGSLDFNFLFLVFWKIKFFEVI